MKRIPELDALRGLAAIGVVFFHAFPDIFFWFWSCVDLFFVLSGYLITTIIITQMNEPGFLKSFYLRRIKRIWPLYYLTLIGLLLINSLSARGYPTDGLLWNAVFLQNVTQYAGQEVVPFLNSFDHSWSVALEEQFYLIWPILLLVLGRHAVGPLAISFLAVCILSRTFWLEPINLLLSRGHGLAFGCLLAAILDPLHPRPIPRVKVRRICWLALAMGMVYALLYIYRGFGIPNPTWQMTCFIGFSLLFFGLIGVTILDSGRKYLGPLRWGPLRGLGTISFAMYMFHLPIMFYMPRVTAMMGIQSVVVREFILWGSIILLPTLSWYLLERPILRSGRKEVAAAPSKTPREVSPAVSTHASVRFADKKIPAGEVPENRSARVRGRWLL